MRVSRRCGTIQGPRDPLVVHPGAGAGPILTGQAPMQPHLTRVLRFFFSKKKTGSPTGETSSFNELLKSLGLELCGFLKEQRMYAEYADRVQTSHSTAMEKYREANAIQDVAGSIRTRPGQALFELRRGGVERAPSPMPKETKPPPSRKRRKGMRDEDLPGSGVPRAFGDVFRNLRR